MTEYYSALHWAKKSEKFANNSKLEADRAERFADDVEVKDYTVYQGLTTFTGATVALQDHVTIYNHTLTGNTTFTFDTSGLLKQNKVITFELRLRQNDIVTVTFPSVSWLNGDDPDMSEANKTYYFVFRTEDNGQSWIGNLQGYF